jgi:hypothetical protein
MNISADQFYVYLYLDPRKHGKYRYGEYEFDYEPFYVGKGRSNGYRITNHLWEAYNHKDSNSHKCNVIRKIKRDTGQNPITLKYRDNILIEQDSFDLEKDLIKTIGRIDLKTGPLVNKTDGGEGQIGSLRTKRWRRNQSKRMQGKNNPNYNGKGHHKDTGKKISKSKTGKSTALKGKPKSEKHKRNLSISRIKLFKTNPELRKVCSKGQKERMKNKSERQKISNGMKEFHKKHPGFVSGKNNGMFGKRISNEHKEKILLGIKEYWKNKRTINNE